jgi:hypothetical protein
MVSHFRNVLLMFGNETPAAKHRLLNEQYDREQAAETLIYLPLRKAEPHTAESLLQ